MKLGRIETEEEYEQRLKDYLEHKEVTRAYTQIKYMRQGFEDLLKMMGEQESGDYYWLKFICKEHMNKKDMFQRYGFNVYDHGDLGRYHGYFAVLMWRCDCFGE